MIQVGDRVRICNLQAPFTYGTLATVAIADDPNPDGIVHIRFDRLERLTTSPSDITRSWWIEKEFIEVVESVDSTADSLEPVEETTAIVLDEEIALTSPAWESAREAIRNTARQVEAETVHYTFDDSAQRAINAMSQQLRERRVATPPVWPDPGYGDTESATCSQETQTQADSPVARSYGGTLL